MFTATNKKAGPGKPKGSKGAGPLATYHKEFIIHMGVLGNTRAQVVEKFSERYHRPLHPRTVSKVWKENRETIDDAQRTITNQGLEILSGDALKQKSYSLIDKRLTRAQADESDIEKLRIQLKAGQITKQVFDVECSRYEQLTINELVKIADMGFEHSTKGGEGPALTPEDQAMLSAMTEGLRSGNPFQLIQVLNPKVYPNGENPVHQAGM